MTAHYIQIFVKGKKTSRTHIISKASGFKKLVRGVARRGHATVARQVLANTKTRCLVIKSLRKYIQKEMTVLCSKKENSMLRGRSVESVNRFSWDLLAKELESKAPTLYGVLSICVDVRRRKRKTKTSKQKSSSMLGVCAAIMLRHRNQEMNLLQRIITLIFHSGHASKQVYNYI